MGHSRTRTGELRFATPTGWALPDLRRVVDRTERLPALHIDSVSYDTSDGRLAAEGVRLRHRVSQGAGPGVWTIDGPAGEDPSGGPGAGRSWPGGRDEIPGRVRDVLLGLTRREPLQRVEELRTERQRLVLHDDGREVAEIDDDTVVAIGGPRDGLRFRQIALDLRPGGEPLRKALVSRLEEAGAPVGTPGRPGPGDGRAVALDRRSTMGDMVRAAIADGLHRLLDRDWRLRLAQPDLGAEDVHRARVACRRLRSHLKTFGGGLDPVWLRHVRDDLAWLGSALGEVRDADVLAAGLEGSAEPLRRALAEERRLGAARVAAVLASRRYLDLLDRLHAAATAVPFVHASAAAQSARAADALPALIGGRFRSVRRQVRRAGGRPTDHRLHRIRIAAKELRYAAELAAPVMGDAARRTAARAKALQTTLGDHHDAVGAEEWLRRLALPTGRLTTTGSPAVAFEAGTLVAVARARRRELARRWQGDWERLAARKGRRWMAV